jgi:hypothetical protein
LDDCSYFIGAGLDTFSGDQAAQYLASYYPQNTPLRVEVEVGLMHISEGVIPGFYAKTEYSSYA